MLTAEQVVAAHKANVETLFGLTNKAFEGVEKLVELNLQVARAALDEAADTTRAALSVKDAQELLALQASLLQPAAEKAASYSRHLYDIASGTGAEFGKAFEAQASDAQRAFDDPFAIDWLDDRENYGEHRFITLGMVDGRLLHVTFTTPDDRTIRIISARRARPNEKRKYHEGQT